jgi:3',5'-cyclic AMP phosphodiesterase CpdA
MDHPNLHNIPRSLLWVFILLAGAVSVISLLIIIIQITGIEIIRIYLQTSFFYFPALVFAISGILVIINSSLALYGAVTLNKKPINLAPAALGILSIMLSILFCTAAVFYIREQYLRGHGVKPSAPERFWAKIGPVMQFGPFNGRGTDAASGIAIWYFDPVQSTEPAEIRYGLEPAPERMKRAREATGDGKRHEFHLTGLNPSSRYYYQIPGQGDTMYTFRTGPARESDEPFRFMVVGDTGNTRMGGYAHSYYRDVMRAADEFYSNIHARPAFRIHAGDAVRSGADLDAWHNYFSSYDRTASIPCVVAPGNHEYLEDWGGNYRYFFGQPDYYSIDYGNARIISINPFDGPGTTLDGPVLASGSTQYRWVKRELARSTGARWLVVVIHNPLLSTGDYGMNELLIAQYYELFRKYRVDLVISGHDHNFDSFHVDRNTDWGGTIYIVAGTGGSNLDSYIMDRPARRWLDWRHDRSSTGGLYQHDMYTTSYHVYGELSWGFTDVEIRNNAMTVSYYRWLDFERFLTVTGQEKKTWDMVYIDEDAWKKNDLSRVTLVKKIVKKKF